jgi:Spy/CpxP family protein refolding chaperone
MKKLMLMAMAFMLVASVAFANASRSDEGRKHGKKHGMHHGESKKHGMHHGHKMGRMAEMLDLSEAQKLQMQTLRESFRTQTAPQREASRQLMGEYRSAKQAGETARAEELEATLRSERAAMHELRSAHREQMLSILTPEQRSQLEAQKQEWKAKRSERSEMRGERKGEQRQFRGSNR